MKIFKSSDQKLYLTDQNARNWKCATPSKYETSSEVKECKI